MSEGLNCNKKVQKVVSFEKLTFIILGISRDNVLLLCALTLTPSLNNLHNYGRIF